MWQVPGRKARGGYPARRRPAGKVFVPVVGGDKRSPLPTIPDPGWERVTGLSGIPSGPATRRDGAEARAGGTCHI